MKVVLFILLLVAESSRCQNVKVQLSKDGSTEESHYLLKIYNDTSVFIGIKSSVSFRYFSEDSVLKVAMANWFSSNDTNSFYDIDCSEIDAQFSDYYSYQLILVAPQTYFMTKIKLIDYDKFNKARFRISYKAINTDEELILYSKRKPGKVLMTNSKVGFLEKIISIPQ